MKRALFIKKVLVFLGITSSSTLLLSSCEAEEREEEMPLEEEFSEEEQAYLDLKEKTKEDGFLLDGKLLRHLYPKHRGMGFRKRFFYYFSGFVYLSISTLKNWIILITL